MNVRDGNIKPETSRSQKLQQRLAPVFGDEWIANGLGLLVWSAIVVGLFWPFLSGESLAGYRDSVQFYWPMFRWEDAVWKAGEVPLWNPHDGLGRSHLAEGTSSLFYPGKLLFWMPWCSFESRYGCYLAAHVWLAGWGAGWLAGRFGADWHGRGLAGLSYGLAGPILFAATNVVYLVSAAWLPWGLGAIWLWRERAGKFAAIRGVAASTALMILGGDPQMAGNLLLLAAGSWSWWAGTAACEPKRWRAVAAAMLAGLLAIACSLALAAAQVIPSWQLSAESGRVGFAEPRSCAEWLLASWSSGELATLNALWQEPEAGTHQADIYEFSQPPWTLGEWVWPGSSGRPFPEWTHWVSGVPGAGRMWQPSLYQGILPLLFALTLVARRELRWLVIVGGLALVASWGWYGPVWVLNEVGLATGWWSPLEKVHRAAGGVYWWLVSLVPGYAWFRYPAKLVILVTLVIAVMAGRGWTEASKTMSEAGASVRWACSRLTLAVVVLSTALLGIALLAPWKSWEMTSWGDDWFGPFSAERFRWQLVSAGMHTLVVGLVGWRLLGSRHLPGRAFWRRLAVLGLCGAELCLANAWLLAGVSVPPLPSARQELPVYWNELDPPQAWRETSSVHRLAEVVRWEVAEAHPRVHWLWNERMLNAPATIEQQAWQEFLVWLADGSQPSSRKDVLTKQLLFEAERVWVLNQPRSTALARPADSIERFRLGLFDSEAGGIPVGHAEPSLQLAGRIKSRTTQTVLAQVELTQPGVVFLAEGYAPGWRVRGREIGSDRQLDLPCLRVGQWLRGVWLEPGKYELQFVYFPSELSWCLIVSAFSWLVLSIIYLTKAILSRSSALKARY